MKKIRLLSGKFQQLKAQHIYREYNEEANHLSKKPMRMEEDVIYYAVGTRKQIGRFERLSIR
jgi:hypothetical protein